MITDQVFNDWKNWILLTEEDPNKAVLENLMEVILQYLKSSNSHATHSVLKSGLECTNRWFNEK